VHAASIATPPTTNMLASDHFGFSNTMPAATEKLATTAIAKSITWGQNGLNEPEKKSLISYLYLLAVGSWLVVAIIAIAKWLWLRRKSDGDHQ
jgi:hypothetical protein